MVHDLSGVEARRTVPLLVSCAVAVVCVLGAGTTCAGGFDFAPSGPSNAGPPYFGVVVDQGGTPVPGAKITVNIAKLNATMQQQSDFQGHFFIQGFYKNILPQDVDITCSKDGYHAGQATKTSSSPTAPVQVVCVLKKGK